LVLSLFCLVFFPLVTIGGVAVTLANPDGSFARPVPFAIVWGIFFGGWSILSLYMLLACLRERLYRSSEAICSVGLFRSRTVLFADVTRAVWRCWPGGGSIVLHTEEVRLAVGFANYAGGKELADFLRKSLPDGVQVNYERYESTNAPGSAAFQRVRERNRRTAVWAGPIIGLAFIALAAWDP
jgi:hypothetical protein